MKKLKIKKKPLVKRKNYAYNKSILKSNYVNKENKKQRRKNKWKH